LVRQNDYTSSISKQNELINLSIKMRRWRIHCWTKPIYGFDFRYNGNFRVFLWQALQ